MRNHSPAAAASAPRHAIPCFHGGVFFEAIGERFDDLERRRDVINADVLDAWFPPAPGVLATLREHLDWLVRTSPPTNCDGLMAAIAEARGVPSKCLLPGAGSSDLIFRAFNHWLTPASRVLLLDPTYGEYVHVCQHVIGCRVERLLLTRATDYQVDLENLHRRLKLGDYDLAVIVNPNNPTGRHVPRPALEETLTDLPGTTMAWIDEAYVDYIGANESLERFATLRPNVVVCKSLSKAYALSGMRAGYLCGSTETLAPLRAWTPPWVIGLAAQTAAMRAIQDPEYYQARYSETAALKQQLVDGLRRFQLDWHILDGKANFVLCHLPLGGPTAAEWVQRCRARGLFVRDVAAMGTRLGPHVLRIAVKDAATNDRMLAILRDLA